MHQGWPKFAASLWMGTVDNGLAAVAYSPSEVKTTIQGTPVHVVEETNYPFDETVTIRVETDKPVTFPMRLRIPAWTSGASVKVNGASQRGVQVGSFLTVAREWRGGDTVVVRFPMPVIVSHGYRGAAVVSRGPLVYSLAVGEKWKKTADNGKASDWDVTPTAAWNYALVINASDPQSSFSVEVRKQGAQPFSAEGTPVALDAKGVRIGEWKLVDGSAGPMPESPMKGGGSTTALTLIPYGAAKLRITEFPVMPRK
jgi:hypothetical protein